MDEEIKAQKEQVSFPKSHSLWMQRKHFNPGILILEIQSF